jgi:hypothetical protein
VTLALAASCVSLRLTFLIVPGGFFFTPGPRGRRTIESTSRCGGAFFSGTIDDLCLLPRPLAAKTNDLLLRGGSLARLLRAISSFELGHLLLGFRLLLLGPRSVSLALRSQLGNAGAGSRADRGTPFLLRDQGDRFVGLVLISGGFVGRSTGIDAGRQRLCRGRGVDLRLAKPLGGVATPLRMLLPDRRIDMGPLLLNLVGIRVAHKRQMREWTGRHRRAGVRRRQLGDRRRQLLGV